MQLFEYFRVLNFIDEFNSIADDVIKLKRSFNFRRVEEYHSYQRHHFQSLTINRTI